MSKIKSSTFYRFLYKVLITLSKGNVLHQSTYVLHTYAVYILCCSTENTFGFAYLISNRFEFEIRGKKLLMSEVTTTLRYNFFPQHDIQTHIFDALPEIVVSFLLHK